MPLRPVLLAFVAAAACASPTPAPSAPDASPDAAPDAEQLDAGRADVGADAAPPDAEQLEGGRQDVAGEASPDAAQPDVPPPDAEQLDAPRADVGPEAAPPDAAADAAPDACTPGATRCAAGPEGAAFEACVGGAWAAGVCATVGVSNTAPVCSGGQCFTCRRADGGAGCSADPLCAEDVDCYRIGHGRCVAGRCAHRGAIRCDTNERCAVWETPTTGSPCVDNARLGVRTCGSSVVRCTHDAMCPAGWRCDLAAGFCEGG